MSDDLAVGPSAEADGPEGGSGVPDEASTSGDATAGHQRLDKADVAADRRWQLWKVANRYRTPEFVQRWLWRRYEEAEEYKSARHLMRNLEQDNARSRVPSGERIELNVIWLVEIYTPNTRDALRADLRRLLRGARGYLRNDDYMGALERSWDGNIGHHRLPLVVREGHTEFAPEQIIDEPPAPFKQVSLDMHTLGASIIAIVAGFVLTDQAARHATEVVNNDIMEAQWRLPATSSPLRSTVLYQKMAALDRWRADLAQQASKWLTDRLPGEFAQMGSAELPGIELLTTEQLQPFQRRPTHRIPEYETIFGIDGLGAHWQCDDTAALRLRGGDLTVPYRGERRQLTAAGCRSDLMQDRPDGVVLPTVQTQHTMWHVVHELDQRLGVLAVQWALTVFLKDIRRRLIDLGELNEHAGRSSVKSVMRLRRELLRTGVATRLTVQALVELARTGAGWMSRTLEFTKISIHNPRDTPKLTHELRGRQHYTGNEILRVETDLRDLLGTSSSMTVAASNLRLQRLVMWLGVLALIATAASVWIGIKALRTTPPASPTPVVIIITPGPRSS